MSGPPIMIPKLSHCHRLGEILQEAELVSAAQVEVALYNQEQRVGLLLGEILALHGWIQQDTADFFAEQWPRLINQMDRKRLGEYLRAAALLDEAQIEVILKEQWQTGIKFGTSAVLKGWLKPETIDFFLAYLFPEQRFQGPLMGRCQDHQATQQALADDPSVSDIPPSTSHTDFS